MENVCRYSIVNTVLFPVLALTNQRRSRIVNTVSYTVLALINVCRYSIVDTVSCPVMALIKVCRISIVEPVLRPVLALINVHPRYSIVDASSFPTLAQIFIPNFPSSISHLFGNQSLSPLSCDVTSVSANSRALPTRPRCRPMTWAHGSRVTSPKSMTPSPGVRDFTKINDAINWGPWRHQNQWRLFLGSMTSQKSMTWLGTHVSRELPGSSPLPRKDVALASLPGVVAPTVVEPAGNYRVIRIRIYWFIT